MRYGYEKPVELFLTHDHLEVFLDLSYVHRITRSGQSFNIQKIERFIKNAHEEYAMASEKKFASCEFSMVLSVTDLSITDKMNTWRLKNFPDWNLYENAIPRHIEHITDESGQSYFAYYLSERRRRVPSNKTALVITDDPLVFTAAAHIDQIIVGPDKWKYSIGITKFLKETGGDTPINQEHWVPIS